MGEKHVIESTILGEERKYVVYLPEGYENSKDKYSIMIAVNANYDPYFAHTASVTQLLSGGARMPPTIVVGVHTLDHARDFFPVPHPRIPDSGKADNFLRFLIEEMCPLIEMEYRTNEFKILYGQSNGGMFTVYTLLTKPDSFNAYVAGSPMLGWGTEVFHERAKNLFSKGESLNRYLYMEYGEHDYDKVIDTVPDFVKIIEQEAQDDFTWDYKMVTGESHAPISTLYNGLSMIFPEWQISTKKGMDVGLEGIQEFYNGLSKKYGIDASIPEEVLSDVGVNWILKEEPEKGRPLLEKMIEMYPESEGGYYLLGVIEQRVENLDKAIQLYKRSLEINPEFTQAKEKLEQLNKDGKI